MKLNIQSLLSGDAESVPFGYELTLPDIGVGDVVFTGPASVRGEVSDNAGYMSLACAVSVPYTAVCARCLDPVKGVFETSFERPLAVKGTLISEDEDEYVLFEEGTLDLDEPASEQVILDFPSRVLCSEDCPGLCPRCGKKLSEGRCGCPEKEPDPRMLEIKALYEEKLRQNGGEQGGRGDEQG